MHQKIPPFFSYTEKIILLPCAPPRIFRTSAVPANAMLYFAQCGHLWPFVALNYRNLTYPSLWNLKPSLSIKILSINNFTTRLLSKLLSDLYIGVHLKGSKKFGSKVINRQFFHRKTVFHMRILSIINFTTKLLSIKDYFLNGPQ